MQFRLLTGSVDVVVIGISLSEMDAKAKEVDDW
jgi:hypothetical protein